MNHLGQVNLVGTYYNAEAIFMEINFLKTLEERDFKAGICEALKMAFTSDSKQLTKFDLEAKRILERNNDSLKDLIDWSIKTKLKHVCDDQNENQLDYY